MLTIIIFIFYIINNKKEIKPKVYISFTTIPSRIAYINEMLMSVDIPEVYEIHLNLEKHLNYDEYHIERLKKITLKLKVYIIDEKLGPLTKIVPTLERLQGTNSLVISVDDDSYYRYYGLKNLINLHNLNIVTGNNEIILTEYLPEITKKFEKIKYSSNILEGAAGILYPVKIITKQMINEMKELTKLSKECYKSDDLIINLILEKYNIERKQTYEFKDIYHRGIKILNYDDKDALHLSEHDRAKFVNGNISNYYHCANLIIDKGIL